MDGTGLHEVEDFQAACMLALVAASAREQALTSAVSPHGGSWDMARWPGATKRRKDRDMELEVQPERKVLKGLDGQTAPRPENGAVVPAPPPIVDGGTATVPATTTALSHVFPPQSLLSENVHPVLTLGWRPLVPVVCNGLEGHFLGGHDRDLYIWMPSGTKAGGEVVTCSQFERKAGRELSKKWKESIHVLEPDRGSRSTLISWLRRHSADMYGSGVVGKKVWVCWITEADHFQGTIVAYDSDSGKHKIQYSDMFSEQLLLPAERLSFRPEKPSLPTRTCTPARCSSRSAAAQHAAALRRQATVPPASAAMQSAAPQQPKLLPTAPAAAPPQQQEGTGVHVLTAEPEAVAAVGMPEEVCGSQPCSPSDVSRRASGAAVVSSDGQGSDSAHCSSQERSPETVLLPQSGGYPSSGAKPLEASHLVASSVERLVSGDHCCTQLGAPPQPPQPPPLSAPIAAAPPLLPSLQEPGGLAARSRSCDLQTAGAAGEVLAQTRWMNAVVNQLDSELQQGMAAAVAGAGGGDGGGPRAVSAWPNPGARFLAVLAQAQHDPQLIQGYYEAMRSRYQFFAQDASLQRRKVAEFVMCALIEHDHLKDAWPERSGVPASGKTATGAASAPSAVG